MLNDAVACADWSYEVSGESFGEAFSLCMGDLPNARRARCGKEGRLFREAGGSYEAELQVILNCMSRW